MKSQTRVKPLTVFFNPCSRNTSYAMRAPARHLTGLGLATDVGLIATLTSNQDQPHLLGSVTALPVVGLGGLSG